MAVISEDTVKDETDGNCHRSEHGAAQGATTLAADSFATQSLSELQSKDYRHILSIVDELRLSGLGSILQLPQLVVCGDQSSGKSSVLEAITQVPFPRKENLCTRFATESNLRRALTDSITTKIIPDQARPDEERYTLSAFNETITDFSRLPELMDKATAAMGLDNNAASSRGTLAFTRDVLSIEISGPEHPQLTLVDLPGLIHTPTKEQTREDVTLIHDLVNEYVEEKRTIMLAVVSAKNDYANQMILDKCRNIDPQGNRTLGIVTKPDTLKAGSVNEAAWIDLVRNKNIHFNLGWHILKNRTEDDGAVTFETRNAHEKAFFSTGAYKALPGHMKGISTLRVRLSQLLYSHLKKELPTLQKEVNARLEQTTETLEELGERRSTAAEQKRFLFGVCMEYQGIVRDAVRGDYALPFFDTSDNTQGFGDPVTARRLRAAVHHLNQQFAIQMRQYGHTFRIATEKDFDGTNAADEVPRKDILSEYAKAAKQQQYKSRQDAINWVHNLLLRSRGMELPGNSNPLFMSQLFWQQSKNWKSLAAAHIERVDNLCSHLVKDAIEHTTLEGLAAKLFETKLEPKLVERYKAAAQELDKLIADKQRPLCTYNPAYTTTLWTSRKKRVTSRTQAVPVNSTVVQKAEGQQDMEKTNAEDALDSLIAYYKNKVEYFIEAVTDQVIERHLLTDLAGETFSPLLIDAMSEREVYQIAGEDEDITSQREHFEGQKEILEKGQAAFRKAIGGFH